MKRFYLTIICQIIALILFLTAHFLISIYYYYMLLSQYFSLFIAVDVVIFLAITIQITSILLLVSIEVSNGK